MRKLFFLTKIRMKDKFDFEYNRVFKKKIFKNFSHYRNMRFWCLFVCLVFGHNESKYLFQHAPNPQKLITLIFRFIFIFLSLDDEPTVNSRYFMIEISV